ncbi:LysM peptidoglycan-binding domain-containing protein [Sphingomonas aerolata]|uniref:LysM peptidoglycan-binding domain-containing protein n=1 Tax=Sphingomonas aerolata TaxID=185951 RepID=UPI002FE15A6C
MRSASINHSIRSAPAIRCSPSPNALGRAARRSRGANAIEPPFTIQAGQRLTIPAGRYHLVRRGETEIAIARAYGVAWSRIVTVNALLEPYVLRAGQRIVIPDTEGGTSLADRAAAFTLDVDDILTGGEPALASNQAPVRPTPTPRRVPAAERRRHGADTARGRRLPLAGRRPRREAVRPRRQRRTQ